MVQNFATSWNLDFDDMYQEACIHIIHVVDDPRIKLVDLPRFANVQVRHRLMDKAKYLRRRQMVSIDAPVSSDSDITLADVLPSPYSHDPESLLLLKERLKSLSVVAAHRLSGIGSGPLRDRYETVLATYC